MRFYTSSVGTPAKTALPNTASRNAAPFFTDSLLRGVRTCGRLMTVIQITHGKHASRLKQGMKGAQRALRIGQQGKHTLAQHHTETAVQKRRISRIAHGKRQPARTCSRGLRERGIHAHGLSSVPLTQAQDRSPLSATHVCNTPAGQYSGQLGHTIGQRQSAGAKYASGNGTHGRTRPQGKRRHRLTARAVLLCGNRASRDNRNSRTSRAARCTS